jgi:hypothetical protein
MTLSETAACRRSPCRAAFRRCIIYLLACAMSVGIGAFAAGVTASATTRASTPRVERWKVMQAPLPVTAAEDPVVSVRQLACAAPGECVGVASFDNKSDVGTGVIEQLRGGRWKATSAPVPRGTREPQKVTLTSVSCPTPASCGVSGYLDTPSTRRSELLTVSHGRWSAQAAPLLPGTLADSQTLSSISCPAPGRAGAWPPAVTRMHTATFRG